MRGYSKSMVITRAWLLQERGYNKSVVIAGCVVMAGCHNLLCVYHQNFFPNTILMNVFASTVKSNQSDWCSR